jgi:hypothetical protein
VNTAKLKYATFFGGARNDTTTKEYLETVEIAQFLAEKGYCIKNGGYRGIMEASSKGARLGGGKAIGITCKEVGAAKGNEFLSETIVTDKLYQRLALLIENTAVFVVQRGGIGTISELFLVLDIIRKMNPNHRPKVYLIGEIWHESMQRFANTFIPKHEHALWQVILGVKDFKKEMETIEIAKNATGQSVL